MMKTLLLLPCWVLFWSDRSAVVVSAMSSTGSSIMVPLLSDGSFSAEMALVVGDDNDDRLHVNVTFQGDSYVAIGFSLDDQMPDSIAVIGTPIDGKVLKYNMTSRSTPTVLPENQQTLEDTSIGYDGAVTTMQFTKLLKESNEPEIDATTNNIFLYAHGNNGLTNLHFHAKYGAVTVNLATMEVGGGGTTPTTPTGGPPPTSTPPTNTTTTSSGGTDLGNGRFQYEQPLIADDSLTAVMITDANAGTIAFTVTFRGESYVAIGFSLDDKMPDSIAVIGTPSDAKVLKYNMASRDTPTVLPASQQTLTDASIAYDGTVTTLKFTKLLKEDNEPEIVLDANNFFLYAHGNDGRTDLHLHNQKGAVQVNFATGEAAVSSGNDHEALWRIHGICLAVAWLLLLPMGIACSIGRAFVPGRMGMWFELHRWFNMVGVLSTMVGFGIAVYLIQDEQGSTAQHFTTKPHRTIGLVVSIGAVVNALGGIFRPHAPATPAVGPVNQPNEEEEEEMPKEHNNNDDNDDYEAKVYDHGEAMNHGTTTSSAPSTTATSGAEPKTAARRAFEIGHRVIGFTTLILAWINVSSGADLYSERFDTTTDYSLVVWIVAAVMAFLMLGLGVAGRCKTAKTQS